MDGQTKTMFLPRSSVEHNSEVARWTQAWKTLCDYGYSYHPPPGEDVDLNSLSETIGIAEAINLSVHDRNLQHTINKDLVFMDLSIIKAMATVFTTSSYRPGLGAYSVPHNPNKRVDPDQLKIRVKYEVMKEKKRNKFEFPSLKASYESKKYLFNCSKNLQDPLK